MFTVQTRVPAFQRACGPMAVRWGERNEDNNTASHWCGDADDMPAVRITHLRDASNRGG